MNIDKSKRKVSICGCGWLGMPLAMHLAAEGYEVWGSRRSVPDRLAVTAEGISIVPMVLPDSLHGEDEGLLSLLSADVLVVNIPPGRQADAAAQFRSNVEELLKLAKLAGCKRVLFISTTAVYGALSGKVCEKDQVEPDTESARAHVWIERYLQEHWQENAVVLRLAGLIGPGRHPVRYLAGREGIENGNAKVNLVHRDDCIHAISRIIDHWPTESVFHLAAPSHPSRAEYYTRMAERAGLPSPGFVEARGDGVGSKWIDATATCRQLGLVMTHTDLMRLVPELAAGC